MNAILEIAARIETICTENEKRCAELLATLERDRLARIERMVDFTRACSELRASLNEIGGAA